MAGSIQDGPVLTLPTDSTLGQYLRVSVGTDGYLNVAGATDKDVGTTILPVLTSGVPASVRHRLTPGTCKFTVSEAVEVGDILYSAASGKVSDTDNTGSGGEIVGIAIEAATADGQIIEAIRI